MTSTTGSAHRRSIPIDEVETLLCSLEGVRAASVRMNPNGSIGTISIVADAETELSPRQIARNVQSALLARHGLLVDHRIVSVQPHSADAPAKSAPRVYDAVLAVIQATGAGSYTTGHTTATAAHDDGASANL